MTDISLVPYFFKLIPKRLAGPKKNEFKRHIRETYGIHHWDSILYYADDESQVAMMMLCEDEAKNIVVKPFHFNDKGHRKNDVDIYVESRYT